MEPISAVQSFHRDIEMQCTQIPSTKRNVMLIKHHQHYYCMDQACYHHGGPLVNGDIEEMGNRIVVKCPWHAYKIAIDTGEGLYMGLDVANMKNGVGKNGAVLKSKGVKQRVHQVEIKDGIIYVKDSSVDETKIESDVYAHTAFKIPDKSKAGEVKLHAYHGK